VIPAKSRGWVKSARRKFRAVLIRRICRDRQRRGPEGDPESATRGAAGPNIYGFITPEESSAPCTAYDVMGHAALSPQSGGTAWRSSVSRALQDGVSDRV
jgi:hypothetical protein